MSCIFFINMMKISDAESKSFGGLTKKIVFSGLASAFSLSFIMYLSERLQNPSESFFNDGQVGFFFFISSEFGWLIGSIIGGVAALVGDTNNCSGLHILGAIGIVLGGAVLVWPASLLIMIPFAVLDGCWMFLAEFVTRF